MMQCIIDALMGHKYILRNAFSQFIIVLDIISPYSGYEYIEHMETIGKGKSGYVGGLDMRQVQVQLSAPGRLCDM